MEKQKVTYTFVDPNSAEVFEQVLCRLLVEKLASGQAQNAPGSGQ